MSDERDMIEALEEFVNDGEAILIPEEIITGESWLSILREGSVWDVVDNKIRHAEKILKNLVKDIDVPEEYRRYVRRDQLSKLPVGTRVHRGPRGGLFIDVREIPESVRERLDVEPEGSEEVAPRREVKPSKYSGSAGDLKYEAVLDEASGKSRLSLVSGDYSIEFDVDINSGKIDVVSAKIPTVDMESIRREFAIQERFVRFDAEDMLERLGNIFEVGAVEKIKDILKNEATEIIGSDSSKTVVKGEDLHVGSFTDYPRIRELVKDKFYRLDDSKVFTHEGVHSDAVRSKLLKYHKMINDNNVGVIVVVPSSYMVKSGSGGQYSVGGFYSPDKDVIYIGAYDLEYGILHEYFHQVYSLFSRLHEVNVLIHQIKNIYYHKLVETFERDDLLYKLSSDNEKVKKALDMVSGRFGHSLSIKAREHYINTVKGDKVAEIVRELQKLLDSYGGEEAVHAFLEMEREFNDDDGLTKYSYSYFEGRSYFTGKEEEIKSLTATESFASIADYIRLVKRLADDDEKIRELIQKYEDRPYKFLNRELYQRVLESEMSKTILGGFRGWDKNIDRKLKAVSKFLRIARGVFKG
jgi:hypothetical protein